MKQENQHHGDPPDAVERGQMPLQAKLGGGGANRGWRIQPRVTGGTAGAIHPCISARPKGMRKFRHDHKRWLRKKFNIRVALYLSSLRRSTWTGTDRQNLTASYESAAAVTSSIEPDTTVAGGKADSAVRTRLQYPDCRSL